MVFRKGAAPRTERTHVGSRRRDPDLECYLTVALRAPTVNHDIGRCGRQCGNSGGVLSENLDTVRDVRGFDHRDKGVEPAHIEGIRVADPDPHHQFGPVGSG